MNEDFECQKCGECCNRVNFFVPMKGELAEVLSAHYGRPIDRVGILIEHRCNHLTDENLCDIYKDRPAYCRQHRCEDPGTLLVKMR